MCFKVTVPATECPNKTRGKMEIKLQLSAIQWKYIDTIDGQHHKKQQLTKYTTSYSKKTLGETGYFPQTYSVNAMVFQSGPFETVN